MSKEDNVTLTENVEKLWTMVDDFRVGMLITRPHDGAPRPRPMTMAKRDGGTVTFVTNRDNALTEELENEAGCAIAMQSDRKYVSLRGLAELDHDIEAIESVWSETMRVWFPDGPKGGRIVLVRVSVIEGEYWDMSGIHMARYLFNAAKAYAKGKPLDEELENPGMHAGVML